MDWFNSSGPNKASTNSHESAISMTQGGNMLQNGKCNLEMIFYLVYVLKIVVKVWWTLTFAFFL